MADVLNVCCIPEEFHKEQVVNLSKRRDSEKSRCPRSSLSRTGCICSSSGCWRARRDWKELLEIMVKMARPHLRHQNRHYHHLEMCPTHPMCPTCPACPTCPMCPVSRCPSSFRNQETVQVCHCSFTHILFDSSHVCKVKAGSMHDMKAHERVEAQLHPV